MVGQKVHVSRQLKLAEGEARPVLASELGLSQSGVPIFWLLVAADDGQLCTVEAKSCRLCSGARCRVAGCSVEGASDPQAA